MTRFSEYLLYFESETKPMVSPSYMSIYTSIYSYTPSFGQKAMAPHSNTLAWKIPWTEELGGLQSRGSLRVGHN